jgi:pimeloyl-ACP methyl ester carboxylesterase
MLTIERFGDTIISGKKIKNILYGGRQMKKILSLFLAVLMLFTVAMPATAVDAADITMNSPLIYIRGAGKNLYKNNVDREDERIYPMEIDTEAIIDELLPITEDLVMGMLTDDYEEYVDTVYNVFAPIFSEVVLGKDGEPMDNSGNGAQDPIKYKTDYFKVFDYDFGYDFRISLLKVAEELDQYIADVSAATGGKKVSLLGRCLGTNLMAAYLTKYPDNARKYLSNIILYVPATDGVDFISKLFSGKLEVQSENLDEFVDYLMVNKNLIEDPTLSSMITILVEMLNYAKVLGLGMDAFQLLVDRLQGELIPKLGLASFVSFPAYWSMVNPEDYEDAKALIFEGKEEEYAGLIEKIDTYYNEVQLGFNERLVALEKDGVNVTVIAKYNIPNIPISEASKELGDFMASTNQLSYGAICADHGKVLEQSYIDSMSEEALKYLSPDKKIDASTCLFPDNTWFMKNNLHDDFPYDGNRLIKLLVESKGEMTVFENAEWPQYIEYTGAQGETEGVFVTVEGEDKDAVKPEEGSGEERFSIFIRFFTAILNFFTKLFNGELFNK